MFFYHRYFLQTKKAILSDNIYCHQIQLGKPDSHNSVKIQTSLQINFWESDILFLLQYFAPTIQEDSRKPIIIYEVISLFSIKILECREVTSISRESYFFARVFQKMAQFVNILVFCEYVLKFNLLNIRKLVLKYRKSQKKHHIIFSLQKTAKNLLRKIRIFTYAVTLRHSRSYEFHNYNDYCSLK